MTEILAVVLRHSPFFLKHFLALFDIREPEDAAWTVQTQKGFRADEDEAGYRNFRPDLLIGSFESELPRAGEGLALEVKLGAGLTLSELRRWPSMRDNQTFGPRPFRRGALVPFGYGRAACLEGTCEEKCDCGGVLDEAERERRAFRCRTWSDLIQEIAGLLGGDVIEEVERQYLYELECFMTDEPKTNVSGDRGLRSDDLDQLPGAQIQLNKVDALFSRLLKELEERGIRTPKEDGKARYQKVWSQAIENSDWARTMHLDGLGSVVIRRDGSSDVELSDPVWWEVGLLADGSKLVNGNLVKGPTVILMLSWMHNTEDPSGLRVEDLESGGDVIWSGPVKLGHCPRIFTSESLVDVLGLGSEGTSEMLDDQARSILDWIEFRIEDLTQREWISISR